MATKSWRPLRKATARDRRRVTPFLYPFAAAFTHLGGGDQNVPANTRVRWFPALDGTFHPTCGDVDAGWTCSLKYRHRGNHEAWATEPLELCHEWPRAGRTG